MAPDAQLFQKYDKDRNGFLDTNELTAYVLENDAPFNDPDFAKLRKSDPAFDRLWRQKARLEAEKIGGFGQITDNSGRPLGDARVSPTDFKVYFLKQNPSEAKKESTDWLTRVTDDHLKIRKSFLEQKDEQLPAQFNWTKSTGTSEVFTVDGAVSYGIPLAFSNGIAEIDPTVEAHLSTNPKATQNSFSAHLPIQLVLAQTHEAETFAILNGSKTAPPPKRGIFDVESHFITVGPVYEMDRSKNTGYFGGEIFYSPSIPGIGLGAPWPYSKNPDSPYFLWRPYVGMEAATATMSGDDPSFEKAHDYVRFALKLHGELHINRHFEIAVDYYDREFLSGRSGGANYVELSSLLYLDDDQHISLGFTYKYGKTTPDFVKIDSVNAFVGIKF